jgi:hypothetical protein
MNVKRLAFVVSTASLLAGGDIAQAQQAAVPTPKQCFVILGEADPKPGSALIDLSNGPANVHLYFVRSRDPFDKMSSGSNFGDVSRSMLDQGLRPVTPKDGGTISFDNGQRATYSITINGSAVTGTIVNPQGVPFPIRGKCD